jgi:predicted ester cyclase
MERFVAPNMVQHVAGLPPDWEGLKQALPMFRDAFPDLEIIGEQMIAEGNLVVDRTTVRGTHLGG